MIRRRWEREDDGDGDLEPFEALVARDPRFEMTPDGTLLRVLSCARCGWPVRFPARAPVRPGAAVRCPTCLAAA